MAEPGIAILKALRHGGPANRENVFKSAGLSPEIGSKALRRLVGEGGARWLVDARSGWIAAQPTIAARVPATIHRLLELSGPLSFGLLRAAWRRQERLKGFVAIPEADDPLRAWFAAFPEFIQVDDRVSIRTPGLVQLDSIAQTLSDVLSRHPSGLTRSRLREACLERGMPPGTFATTLTYSPLVTPVARDLWALTSEQAVEIRVPQPRAGVRRSRRVTYAWTDSGELQLTGIVSSLESPVMHVPREVARLVEEKRFQVEGGEITTQDVAVKAGTVWGFAPFLTRAGAHVGDVIHLRFDLLSRTVTLHLVRARDGELPEVPER